MPTVQPPPPSPPAAATPQPGQAVAVAVKAPVAINQLAPGQALQATAQTTPSAPQSLPSNQVQVQTALGEITLQTALPIPKGAVLTLALNQLTPQPQFLITAIDGKPVPAAQAALKTAGRIAQSLTQTTSSPSPPLAAGAQVSASLLRPAILSAPMPASASLGAAPPLQTGAQTAPPQSVTLTGQAQTSSAPLNLTGRPPPTPAPQGAPATPPPPSSAQPVQSTLQTIQVPSGTRFTVSVVRIDPPSVMLNTPTPPSASTLTPGAVFNGTVTGATPQGQPIVQTPHATIALETTAKVVEGARVIFKLESVPVPPSAVDASKLGRFSEAGTLVQARAWPQLDEALKVLAHADPARFDHVAQNALPRPGAKLTSQMLFFLSALKGGDIKSWLGDTVNRVIERDRPGLTGRLSGDFQIMSKLADSSQSGDWRLALVPLWGSDELEQLRMYYRNHSGQEGEDESTEETRFILDIDLSNIGHLQMDGLMKPEDKRLDLIVRTDAPLPEGWRTDIGEIFITAQDITGLKGSLAFQAAPGNFVEFPPIETPSPHPGLLI